LHLLLTFHRVYLTLFVFLKFNLFNLIYVLSFFSYLFLIYIFCFLIWFLFLSFAFSYIINFRALYELRLSLRHWVVIFESKTIFLINFIIDLINLLAFIFWLYLFIHSNLTLNVLLFINCRLLYLRNFWSNFLFKILFIILCILYIFVFRNIFNCGLLTTLFLLLELIKIRILILLFFFFTALCSIYAFLFFVYVFFVFNFLFFFVIFRIEKITWVVFLNFFRLLTFFTFIFNFSVLLFIRGGQKLIYLFLFHVNYNKFKFMLKN
jgi:hypothetical protein